MSDTFKIQWVYAMLANRLQHSLISECEIFFSYFLTVSDIGNPYQFTHIYDEKTTMDFWKSFNFRPTGGKK